MFNRVGTVVGTGLFFALMAGPALAGVPVPLPEPATITVFGIAAVGALVARKFWGGK